MKLGIDIIDMDDFKRRIDKKGFKEWVFTQNEILNCIKKIEPWKCFAGKFAVKESMIKVLYNETCKGLRLIDYEILNDKNGKPYVKGYEDVLVSVSYTDKYVIAMVVYEGVAHINESR